MGLLLVITFIAVEVMAVATAMPTAVRELRGLAWYGWSFTAVLGTGVVGMVAAGDMADRRGPRRPLLIGLVAFGAGLLVAGVAPAMAVFILGRALQGLGSGMLIVSAHVVVGDVYPESLRPKVFGAISAAWVLPSLVGPLVAGVVAGQVGWRAVFLGMLPLFALGSAVLVPAVRRLPPRRPAWPGALAAVRVRRRWAYAVAAAAGIGLIQFAGQQPSRMSLLPLLAGLVLLGAGLRRLLPAGTVRLRRGVPAVVAFRGILAGSFFAVESMVPLTLTVRHGFSAPEAGLPLMVGTVGWAIASWWQGRYEGVSRVGLLRCGFVLMAVSAAGMAVVAAVAGTGWLAYPVWAFGGLGAGLVMPSVGVLVLALTRESERGANTSALQISDAVLSALCIGLGGALVAASQREVIGLPTAVAVLNVLMAALALTGSALSGRARPEGATAG